MLLTIYVIFVFIASLLISCMLAFFRLVTVAYDSSRRNYRVKKERVNDFFFLVENRGNFSSVFFTKVTNSQF